MPVLIDNVISLFPKWAFPVKSKVADKAVTTLSKPLLRGHLNAAITRNLAVGFMLSALSGLTFKVLVCDMRKRKYAEFYRNYDAEKVFEDMRKKGVFQSC